MLYCLMNKTNKQQASRLCCARLQSAVTDLNLQVRLTNAVRQKNTRKFKINAS